MDYHGRRQHLLFLSRVPLVMKRFDIDELRLIVKWANCQRESVNQAFTTEELTRLFRHTSDKSCPYEFFDDQEAFDYAVNYLKGKS